MRLQVKSFTGLRLATAIKTAEDQFTLKDTDNIINNATKEVCDQGEIES